MNQSPRRGDIGPDPHVAPADRRRMAAIAGHAGDPSAPDDLVADPDATVRAVALSALARLGALRPERLLAGLADPDAGVRRRACEIVGTGPEATGESDPGWRSVALVAALGDPDPLVAEMAAWSLGELLAAAPDGGPVPATADIAGGVEALAAVAGSHPDPLTREAAVAALGAIGSPTGLEAVLDALDDKPAVRRRAAVALAGFDDRRADDGLRRCLGDRDWQVRQVAETLLDLPPDAGRPARD